jgi:hypothetical protein
MQAPTKQIAKAEHVIKYSSAPVGPRLRPNNFGEISKQVSNQFSNGTAWQILVSIV